jgi:hypothetical protein
MGMEFAKAAHRSLQEGFRSKFLPKMRELLPVLTALVVVLVVSSSTSGGAGLVFLAAAAAAAFSGAVDFGGNRRGVPVVVMAIAALVMLMGSVVVKLAVVGGLVYLLWTPRGRGLPEPQAVAGVPAAAGVLDVPRTRSLVESIKKALSF